MIKKLIIMLVVIVCVSSGAFAIFSEYTASVIDNNTTDTNVNVDSISNVKEVSYSNYFSDFDDYWQYSYGFVKNVDGELRHYLNAYGLYYLESDGLVDMYIQCVECGGFIPWSYN